MFKLEKSNLLFVGYQPKDHLSLGLKKRKIRIKNSVVRIVVNDEPEVGLFYEQLSHVLLFG